MKNYTIQIKNKILLSTILVGVLSVSFLGGCNNPPPGNGSGSGNNLTTPNTQSTSPSATSSVSPTPKTSDLKTQLEKLKTAISENTKSNSFEPAEVKSQWDAFKEKYNEYVNKLEPKNQKEIAQPILDLIQKKISKVGSILLPLNQGNQPNNSAEVVQEDLGEIEDCLGAIEKILQALESSDKFTPLNKSNKEEASSDFQPDLTFWLVLPTFVLVLVLVLVLVSFLIFLALKDDQARRKNRSEESQKNTNNPKPKLQEILEISQKLEKSMSEKFVELNKIITSNKESNALTLMPNQILELNNQIPAIKSSVQNMQFSVNEFKSKFSSVEGSLNQFKENYSTINSTQISEQIITRLEGQIKDNAKANDIQILENKLEALENNLKEEFQGLKELQKQNHVSNEHKQESVTEQPEKAETLSREKAEELEARIKHLEEENKRLKDEQLNEFANQEELNKQIKKINSLEDENSQIKNELNRKDNKIYELQSQIQELETSTKSPENRTNSSQQFGAYSSSYVRHSNPTESPQKIANPLPQKIANLVEKYNRQGIESLKLDATIQAKVSEPEETYNNRRGNSSQPLILTSGGREEYMIVSVDGGTGSGFWVFPYFSKITYSLFNATGKDLFDFNKNPSASGNDFTLKKPAKVIPYESGWKLQEKGEIEITS